MGTQKQFCIVKLVKIVNRIRGSELDSLDLLQIDEIDLLRCRSFAAETHTVKGLFKRLPELSVKQGWQGGILDGIISLFRGVIDNLASIYQNHELVGVHVDDGTVGNRIIRSLRIGPSADFHAAGEDCLISHIA